MVPALVERASHLASVVHEAQNDLAELIPLLRSSCTHPVIADTGQVNQERLPSLQPRRMCLQCGIEEEGWGAGFQALLGKESEIVHFPVRRDFYLARPYPGHVEVWGWCYGFDEASAHGAPKEQIGGHCRCKQHT